MGELLERSKLGRLVYGAGDFENYKNNSLFFYESFSQSNKLVEAVDPASMQIGGFYHLHYMDDSNWMKYSPIFTVDFKKFKDKIIVFGVNFNFLPIEVRIATFDKVMTEENFEQDRLLSVNFEGIYKELQNFGFEYAIVEYNIAQIKLVHKIAMSVVPRFLYSSHPVNKYDPGKLYGIWNAKISGRQERDAEMSKLTVDKLVDTGKEFDEESKSLRDHLNRVRKSIAKYG